MSWYGNAAQAILLRQACGEKVPLFLVQWAQRLIKTPPPLTRPPMWGVDIDAVHRNPRWSQR